MPHTNTEVWVTLGSVIFFIIMMVGLIVSNSFGKKSEFGLFGAISGRIKKLAIIAKEFNFSFSDEIILNEIGDTKRANIIEGKIGNTDIVFYDAVRQINMNTEINRELGEQNLPASEKKFIRSVLGYHKIASLPFVNRSFVQLVNGGFNTPRQTSPEMISFLKINGISKMIGFRYATINIVDRSDAFMSLKLLKLILDEVAHEGYSSTFNSLKSGNKDRFYVNRMLYVRNVS